jgi:hypothetical protein
MKKQSSPVRRQYSALVLGRRVYYLSSYRLETRENRLDALNAFFNSNNGHFTYATVSDVSQIYRCQGNHLKSV